jgi:hypothetical protein
MAIFEKGLQICFAVKGMEQCFPDPALGQNRCQRLIHKGPEGRQYRSGSFIARLLPVIRCQILVFALQIKERVAEIKPPFGQRVRSLARAFTLETVGKATPDMRPALTSLDVGQDVVTRIAIRNNPMFHFRVL